MLHGLLHCLHSLWVQTKLISCPQLTTKQLLTVSTLKKDDSSHLVFCFQLRCRFWLNFENGLDLWLFFPFSNSSQFVLKPPRQNCVEHPIIAQNINNQWPCIQFSDFGSRTAPIQYTELSMCNCSNCIWVEMSFLTLFWNLLHHYFVNAGTELCLQLEMAPHHSEIRSMRILVWHFQSMDTFLPYLL